MNFKYSILFICFVKVLDNCYAADDLTTLRNGTLDRGITPDCTFNEKDIELHVYSRDKRNGIILKKEILKNYDLFQKSQISHQIAILIHGFLSTGNNENFDAMAKALIEIDNFLVISVDWKKGACNAFASTNDVLGYSQAVGNTRHVGKYVADFTKLLVEQYKVPMSNIRLIGHSLGAHTSGFAGKEVQRLKLGKYKEIIGLDPAGPSFLTNKCPNRLCETDAEYVQAIHTSAILGVYYNVGSVDFYVNYGKSQPGCSEPSCSHTKAVKYLTECIKRECCLIGTPWKSYFSTPKPISQCKRDTCVCVGLNAQSYPAKGSFYVPVDKDAPYCHNEGIKL
ncbi:PREDICTED: phospholipase A1 1 [Polistes dominula]|uniref:Phospholipase A1 1 n=1 Tax=Polistes dominula TaxID=743375 RepID=PA11_POLDO|nr:PREDICTED: phospholipase A1 1 [Polistes dominula]Q6Q252.1 RecName: Full=Phospholipase A1 1; Short=PLA1 1; AltName: Allergen=Pol d 1; Flags: Precursor [Polistes dominula]AAS67041.1 venom phospholipase A1 1 precursor [Polistes dominula]